MRRLYNTIFVLICHFRGQSANEIPGLMSGIVGVSMLEIAVATSLALWIQKLGGVQIGVRPNIAAVLVVGAVLYFVNYRLLVANGEGVRFEEHLKSLQKDDADALVRHAVIVICLIIMALLLSIFLAAPVVRQAEG